MARRKTGPRAWVRVSDKTKKLPASRRRWEVVYEEATPPWKRHTKGGFGSKGEAERYRDTETPAAKVRAGQPYVDPADGDVTFQAVAEEWLATYVSESGKARGRAQHHGIIHGKRSLVRMRWGAVRVGDIKHGDVVAWLADLGSRRSVSTRRHNFYTFRLVIRHAIATGRLAQDPTAAITKAHLGKRQSLRSQQAKRYALTSGQIQALIDATPYPWAMYTRLAAATGMRPEELTGLQVRDLDLGGGTVRVERVWVKDEIGRRWIYEQSGKTDAAHRTVRLDDFTAQHLRAYLALHADRAERFFDLHSDRRPTDPQALPLFPGVGEFKRGQRQRQHQCDLDSWEFANEEGEPSALRHGWFTRRYWKAIRATSGVPDAVVFYDLRHFYGSWHAARLGQVGALTLAELAESMGHTSTQMTLDRYVHVEPDVDKRNAGADMWAAEASNVTRLPVPREA